MKPKTSLQTKGIVRNPYFNTSNIAVQIIRVFSKSLLSLCPRFRS